MLLQSDNKESLSCSSSQIANRSKSQSPVAKCRVFISTLMLFLCSAFTCISLGVFSGFDFDTIASTQSTKNANETTHHYQEEGKKKQFARDIFSDSCLAKANDNARKMAETWVNDGVPILSFLTIAPPHDESIKPYLGEAGQLLPTSKVNSNTTSSTEDNNFLFITFATKHGSRKGRPRKNSILPSYIDRASWTCGTNQPAYPVGIGADGKSVMTIQCPIHWDMEIIRVRPKTNNEVDVAVVKDVTYNVSEFMKCLKVDYEASIRKPTQLSRVDAHHERSETTKMKLATCFVLILDHNRRHLKEYIAFHTQLGFDHFFIYLQEPYKHSEFGHQFPQTYTSHISYIPADLVTPKIQTLWNGRIHQHTIQNDCIHKARAKGVDWLLMTDVDEFLRYVPNATTSTSMSPPSIADFLNKKTVEDYRAVEIQGYIYPPFRGPPPLDLDLTLRTTNVMIGAMKTFLRPDLVLYHAVHTVADNLGRKGIYQVQDHELEPSFAHYRIPGAPGDLVVNTTEEQQQIVERIGLGNLVEDTRMRDLYRTATLARMQSLS